MKTVKMQKSLIGLLCLIMALSSAITILGLTPKEAQAESSSIFSFTQTSETECSVRLIDKTATKAYIPEKAIIGDTEYTVTSIANNGFASATQLTKVRLPKSIKTIGTAAFSNCKALRSITLPAVEVINANAFNLCANLDYVIIPETIRTVAATVFRSAPITVHVRVPESDTANWATNWNIVSGTTTTTTIYDSKFVPEIEYKKISMYEEQGIVPFAIVGDYYIVDEAQPFTEVRGEEVHVYIPATYTDPETNIEYPVRGIAENAFAYNDIASITIGYSEDPINIASYAFWGLNGEQVIINRDVTFENTDYLGQTTISEYLFADSTVETIVLPDSLSVIGAQAFNGCANLKDIQFITPTSLSKEEEESIVEKLNLTGVVTLPATENFYKIGDEAFAYVPNINGIVIPENVKEVGQNVFDGWTNGQEITIGYQQEGALPWDEETQTGWHPSWNVGCNKETIIFQGEFQIIYNLNGGVHSGNPDKYNSKDNITLNPATRNGYTFGGWFDNAEFAGDSISAISKGSSGDKELYAKWIANKYSISYDANKPHNASGEVIGYMANSTHEYDVTSSLSANLYKLEGWIFIGWNTESNGSGRTYTDEESIKNLTNINDSEIPLYAIWEEIHYSVAYHSNKPSSASGSLIGNMQNESHAYDEEFKLQKNGYELTGWKFVAWSTKPDGSGDMYTDQENVKNLAANSNSIFTLYAQWEENKYTITFNSNKPSNASENIIGSMDDVEFTYDVPRQLTGCRFSLLGWKFVGWNTKSNGTGNMYFNGESVKNLTAIDGMTYPLYAQWEAVEYYVEYYANKPSKASGNIYGTTDKSIMLYDTSATLNNNGFILTGWHFIGWNTKADGSGESYSNKQTVWNLSLVDRDTMALYAQWEANYYNVQYLPNKPSNATHEVSGSMSNTSHKCDEATNLRSNQFALVGWKFLGWSYSSNGSIAYGNMAFANELTDADNQTITLYAIWKANEYTIKYEKNNSSATGNMPESKHTYDIASTLNSNRFSLSGYQFIGWATYSNGAKVYNNNASILNLASIDGETIYLYAKWEKLYKIEVDGSVGYRGYTGEPWTYIPLPYENNTYFGLMNQVISIPNAMERGYYFTWREERNGQVYYHDIGFNSGAEYRYVVKGDAKLVAQKRETTLQESGDIYTVNQLKQLQNYSFSDSDVFTIYNDLTVDNWTPISGLRGQLSAGQKTPTSSTRVTITINSFSGSYENMGFVGTNISGRIYGINFYANINTRNGTVKNVGVVIGKNESRYCYLTDCTVSGTITCYSGQNVGNDIFNEIHGYGIVGTSSSGSIMNNVVNKVKVDVANPPSDSCLMDGTLITLADGRQVPVETLTGNELLLVWNMHTGKFDVAPIIFLDKNDMAEYEIIRLYFSDGTNVGIIYEHAFFDITLNKYIFFGNDNLGTEYIGHWFNKQVMDANGNLSWKKVQLTNITLEKVNTHAWSPVTYEHLCYYVNGMLSMPGGVSKLVNIFNVDSKLMQYDQDAFVADLERYGVFTYEEFAEMLPISEAVFEAFGGQYLKVAMGKGLVTWEDLQKLVERYSEFFVDL